MLLSPRPAVVAVQEVEVELALPARDLAVLLRLLERVKLEVLARDTVEMPRPRLKHFLKLDLDRMPSRLSLVTCPTT